MENKKGKFFVFEGLDGSGKATQAKLLVESGAETSEIWGRRGNPPDHPQSHSRSPSPTVGRGN